MCIDPLRAVRRACKVLTLPCLRFRLAEAALELQPDVPITVNQVVLIGEHISTV